MSKNGVNFDDLMRDVYVSVVPDSFWTELPNDYLWHYTNYDSAFGIISNQEIWLSDFRTLNDASEVRGELLEIIRICQTAIQKNKTLERLLRSSDGKTFDELNILDEQIFIFSLSEMRDDLNQWKGYASSKNGLSIGFDFFEEPRIFGKESEDIYIGKVIYEPERKIEILTAYFEQVLQLTDTYTDIDEEERHQIVIQVELFLQICCVCFKNSVWKDENEVRVFAIHRNFKSVAYRIKRGNIVPFGRIKIGKKCIREIIFLDNDFDKMTMFGEFLCYNKRNKICLSESKAKFRF